jgi:putative AlgH/UPF0301 family transcriptional regulator
MGISNLKGILLLSSFEGDMHDDTDLPNLFSGSVVYIYADDDNGVKGVVLNKPFLPDSKVIVSGLDISLDDKQEANLKSELYLGGSSCLNRVSVVYADESNGVIKFSGAKKTVRSCLLESYNINNLFLIGESSWYPGEIYPEIANGWWHIVPSSSYIVFGGEVDLMYSRALQSISSSSSQVVIAPFHGRA